MNFENNENNKQKQKKNKMQESYLFFMNISFPSTSNNFR